MENTFSSAKTFLKCFNNR